MLERAQFINFTIKAIQCSTMSRDNYSNKCKAISFKIFKRVDNIIIFISPFSNENYVFHCHFQCICLTLQPQINPIAAILTRITVHKVGPIGNLDIHSAKFFAISNINTVSS